MGCLCLLPVQFQSFVTCDAEQVLHSKCCTASVARANPESITYLLAGFLTCSKEVHRYACGLRANN